MRTLARMATYFLQIAFWLTLVLGGLALVLTVSGLFSVLSYLVEQRTKEIGVRIALGATTRNIGTLVLSQSMRPVGVGLLAGGGLAVALGIALLATPVAAQIGAIVRVLDPVAYVVSLLCHRHRLCVCGADTGTARRADRSHRYAPTGLSTTARRIQPPLAPDHDLFVDQLDVGVDHEKTGFDDRRQAEVDPPRRAVPCRSFTSFESGAHDMATTNKEIVDKVNAAFAQNNHEGFLSHCADDVVFTMVGDKTVKGKDAIRKWMASMGGEPPTFTVQKVIAEGDFATSHGEMTMKGKDGRPGSVRVLRSLPLPQRQDRRIEGLRRQDRAGDRERVMR